MSVTMKQILSLPSLSKAEVVAGKMGLDHIVTSVSVLEYANSTSLSDELFQKVVFQGGEVVISALVSVKDDVDAQCACIQRLYDVGEVGLILYYVGVFLPEIHERIIQLANKLSFPIICMPKKRKDLRYSEVIMEVSEAIFQEDVGKRQIVTELLERISLLPPHQRSMDTILRMVSDRSRCSIYVLNSQYQLINEASWPKIPNVAFSDVQHMLHQQGEQVMKIHGQLFYMYCEKIEDQNQPSLPIVILKEGAPIVFDIVHQILEIVQLFINIWGKGHGNVGQEELIRAILNDEPVKMRQLGSILDIDVFNIHSMWMLHTKEDLHQLQQQTDAFLLQHYHSLISAIHDDYVIAFMGKERIKGNAKDLHDVFLQELKQDIIVCGSYSLEQTSDVRRAYLDIIAYLKDAIIIYPSANYITLQQLQVAVETKAILNCGEERVQDILHVLSFQTKDSKQQEELLNTLEIHLLDTNLHIQETAKQLFVHKNTVKYRLHIIEEQLHMRLSETPEMLELYRACALRRLLKKA